MSTKSKTASQATDVNLNEVLLELEPEGKPISLVEHVRSIDPSLVESSNKDAGMAVLESFISKVMDNTLTWDKNLTNSINLALEKLDALVSLQLREILLNKDFKRLEGSWLGVKKLLETESTNTTIKLFDAEKEELLEDFDSAFSIEKSKLYAKVYVDGYSTAGSAPFGFMLCDYDVMHSDEDLQLMNSMASLGEASHTPMAFSASLGLFGIKSSKQLGRLTNIENIFDEPDYAAWNRLKEEEKSRYLVLTLPKVLARLPYGNKGKKISNLAFEEVEDADISADTLDDLFTWRSASYDLVSNIIQSFSKFGWCVAIRGSENGGKVTGLPVYTYQSREGNKAVVPPTQVGINDIQEKAFNDMGMMSLVHYKDTDFGVFIGGQTMFSYDEDDVESAIASRLPFVMATSRIAHYLKVIGRNKIGSNLSIEDVERFLNSWISSYVNSSALDNNEKAKYPLKEAKITVVENAVGKYSATIFLVPWMQMESLDASIRMSTQIPT